MFWYSGLLILLIVDEPPDAVSWPLVSTHCDNGMFNPGDVLPDPRTRVRGIRRTINQRETIMLVTRGEPVQDEITH